MIRKVLAAGIAAAGIGLTGTASEANAHDFRRGPVYRGGGVHHHHHHFYGGRGRVAPVPFHHRGGFVGRRGVAAPVWGGPGWGGPGWGAPIIAPQRGFFIGGRNFSLGVFR